MRKLATSVMLALAMSSMAAYPVLADTPPDFPEQPGSHVFHACTVVTTGPGQGLVHAAPPALAITAALLADACPMP